MNSPPACTQTPRSPPAGRRAVTACCPERACRPCRLVHAGICAPVAWRRAAKQPEGQPLFALRMQSKAIIGRLLMGQLRCNAELGTGISDDTDGTCEALR
eukprot:366232-Chlamydomonas_euryale.AAC.11